VGRRTFWLGGIPFLANGNSEFPLESYLVIFFGKSSVYPVLLELDRTAVQADCGGLIQPNLKGIVSDRRDSEFFKSFETVIILAIRVVIVGSSKAGESQYHKKLWYFHREIGPN
jgi:hypothetical protein